MPNPNTNPDPSKVVSVKIFPPIGIARLGDSGFDLHTGLPDKTSTIDYFIPSEIPGVEDVPAELGGKFRDSKGRIKRQAVRFRVYAFDDKGKNLGEITHNEGVGETKCKLTWTVQVANAKGSFHVFRGIDGAAPGPEPLRNPSVQPGLEYDKRTKLIVNPDEAHISGIDKNAVDLTGKFQGSQKTGVDVGLGQLRTDDKGRLVFVPAPGYSRSVADPNKPHFQPGITSAFDSIDWVDDTCDGWVDVRVEFGENQSKRAEQKATIISAPPKFAWGMTAPTSLYDLIENIYWVKEGKPKPQTEFYQHIWPVLRGAYLLSWTDKKAYSHGPTQHGNFLPREAQLKDPSADSEERKKIFCRLREPNYKVSDQASRYYMPLLSGNSGRATTNNIKTFAALTELQYEHFKQWNEGNFSNKTAPWEKIKKFEDVPLDSQPLFLTRSALEHTIGEPLFPGIEAYWVMEKETTYNLSNISHKNPDPPFRIDHNGIKPGHLGRGLSLPWQCDFNLCGTEWWPSIRPDDVLRKVDWNAWNTEKMSVEVFSENFRDRQKKWDRIMQYYDRDTSHEDYPVLTNMVRFWQRLGFVSKHKDYAVQEGTLEMPVWLEDEDLPHPQQSAV